MQHCRVEELILTSIFGPILRDHVHEWNATESHRCVHSSRPIMTRLGTRFNIRLDPDKTSHRNCSGSAGASVVAHSVALPLIEIAFSTLNCSIVPTCGAWCSATAAKRGPLKQSWAEIQHSRDDEPLGVLMQMRNVRVNGFFFFSSLGVLPGVLVDSLSLCGGNFCVECVLIVLHKFYIEL